MPLANKDLSATIDIARVTLRSTQVTAMLIAAYLLFLLLIVINLPKTVWFYYETRTFIIGFGFLGIWRYGWWLQHVIRAMIYGFLVFPKRRIQADQLWNSGWRPSQLFFMMTTFKELPTSTELVLHHLVNECRNIAIPTKLFIGTGCAADDASITDFFAKYDTPPHLHVQLVRQHLPGKRFAISDTLKAIIHHGLTENDPVIFMDGDTLLMPDCLRQCLPFFPLHPNLHALTTNEKAILKNGPPWMQKWLDLRFAQRHFTMQSYSLANKVLTLTGRMSIFRGKHLLAADFLQIIENDQLHHWLWGQFRFLSGDDKSTWYYLLQQRAAMFYIPDAMTITIEHLHGSASKRMLDNLRRWSGNILRNGARAIALGPRTTGFYIWWSLLDQRISMWTLVIGHLLAIVLAITKTPAFLLLILTWIAFSRLCMSSVLFFYARRIDMTFPFLLYLNQLLTAMIKIYIVFRLPQQRWTNRGEQCVGFEKENGIRNWIANYLTFFYCVSFLLLILLYLNVISLPTLADIKTLWI